MDIFTDFNTWVALLTLIFLEIVLGIDNIIFISITTAKLPQESQKKATNHRLIACHGDANYFVIRCFLPHRHERSFF